MYTEDFETAGGPLRLKIICVLKWLQDGTVPYRYIMLLHASAHLFASWQKSCGSAVGEQANHLLTATVQAETAHVPSD